MNASTYKPQPTHGCQWIELDAVYRALSHGWFYCHFSHEGKKWSVELRPSDLQTFAAFQRKVASTLGLWVRHDSEQQRTAKLQADDWKLAVECAWRAGS
jgi:hypothetical protein